MKSRLLSLQDLTNVVEFNKDIEILCGLDSEVIRQLPSIALRSLEIPTDAESEKLREAVAEKLGVPFSKLGHALSVPTYLMKQFAPNGDAENDQPTDILDDLIELGSVPKEKSSDVLYLFEETKKIAQDKVQMILLHKAYGQMALPVLRSVSTVVDFRAIFNEAYKYENDISQFSPKFMGTLPLGIVELRLKGAHSNEIFFQVNKRTLQVLIDTLVALQRQIDLAEKEINKS